MPVGVSIVNFSLLFCSAINLRTIEVQFGVLIKVRFDLLGSASKSANFTNYKVERCVKLCKFVNG